MIYRQTKDEWTKITTHTRSTSHQLMPKFRITPKKGDAIRIYHKGSIIHYLCLPNDKQERCPITHDLISQHHLTFLPEDATPTPNKPKHVVMQLPCGHRFCALTMYYHMISNDQRCPMCRSGAHEIFEDSMLPEHLKVCPIALIFILNLLSASV